jgi:hypothetical protein
MTVLFSPSGNLTWLQMKEYEADNDIIVDFNGVAMNLTGGWDGTVDSFFGARTVRKSISQLQLMVQNNF